MARDEFRPSNFVDRMRSPCGLLRCAPLLRVFTMRSAIGNRVRIEHAARARKVEGDPRKHTMLDDWESAEGLMSSVTKEERRTR